MDRDEIYRRAMSAALAVTGGRLARVSLGLYLASSSVGCIEDANFDDAVLSDAAVADGVEPDVMVRDPDMRPDLGMDPPEDWPRPDASTDLVPVDDDEPDTNSEIMPIQADMGLSEPAMDDPSDTDDDDDDGDGMLDDDEPIDAAETCLPEDGALTDWRCCDGHGWDRSIAGCTPCDFRTEPSEWTECVTCETLRRGHSPAEIEEYMACCDAVRFDFEMGCMAWGPPAPPEFDGRTLNDIFAEHTENRP